MPSVDLVSDPTADRWGKLRVVEGRNIWRVVVSRRFGPSAKALMLGATATARMLSLVQPSTSFWYPYWGSWSSNAIAAGEARPIIPVDVSYGGPEAAKPLGIGNGGELLGKRWTFLPAPADTTPVIVNLVEPTGGYPCYWVHVEFWWRAATVDFPSWPFIQSGLEQWAALDTAGVPNVQNDPGDKTIADQVSETGREIVEHSLEDWDQATAAVAAFGRSRGTAFIAGGVMAVLGLLWLGQRGRR